MAGKKTPKNKPEKQNLQFPTTELAKLWRIPFSDETEQSKVESALRERVKELNCLYGVSHLAERHFDSVDDMLRELVNFLPHSWQYPEITCARIIYHEKTYKSRVFKLTNWRQTAQIYVYSEPVGEVAMFYMEECPPEDEGPFLKEERALLEALAEQIGRIAARISAEQELQEINTQLTLERKALQESNLAIRTVISRIEDEKQEIYRNMKNNVDKVIMPLLNALMMQLGPSQIKYIEVLKAGLDDITSPFISRLSSSYHSLTPTEVAICNMVRDGHRTKEIASIRGVSIATVNRHRENIRKKLKITNSDVNLTTYLQSSMWEK